MGKSIARQRCAYSTAGSVSKVEMATPMALIYKVLFPYISTFETPPCAEAHSLFQALVETVNTYSETHPDLSLMACYIAADMLREMLRQAVRDTEADA
jgi:hypothetical protein